MKQGSHSESIRKPISGEYLSARIPGEANSPGSGFFLYCMLLLLVLAPSQTLAETAGTPRGPVRLEDQFTLSIPRLTFSPDSAEILREGKTSIRTFFSVSNTINRKGRSFTIDSEDRNATLEFRHGLNKRLEIGGSIPVLWRGGGVLDSAIFDWHSFFGLPQGPRDDVDIEEDEFTVRGRTDDGGRFNLSDDGVHLGDLRARLKYLLHDKPLVSTSVEFRLPTGASAYGSNGIDFLWSAFVQFRYSDIVFHNAGAYSFYSAPKYEEIEYQRHRVYYSSHIEYIWNEDLSLIAGLILHSNLLQNVERFPNYLLYLDMGIKMAVSREIELELLIRENPAPERGSSDFTGLIGIKIEI